MLTVDDHQAASLAIAGFLVGGLTGLPPATAAAIMAAQGQLSPYDRYVAVLEALFAAGDDAGAAGWSLCGALARFASLNFGPLAPDDGPGDPARSLGIATACRRRLGELTAADAPPASDPQPLARYIVS